MQPQHTHKPFSSDFWWLSNRELLEARELSRPSLAARALDNEIRAEIEKAVNR